VEGVGTPNQSLTSARRWTGHWQRLFWVTVSLVGLVNPARSLTEIDPVWPAATGLAAFALLYVALLWGLACWGEPASGGAAGRLRLVGLGLFAALGVGLDIAYGAGPGQGWALVMVYVAVAGTVLLPQPRASIGWLVGVAVTQVAIGAAQFPGGGASALTASTELTLVVANTLLVGGLIHVWGRRDELIGHLRRTQAQLAEAAVNAERLRFSRDLHDLLGHTLSLIVVKAEVAKRSAGHDPATAAREAGEIEQIGRRALAEVREAVTGYRERAFASELDAARTALADAGLRVSVQTTGTPLPAPADSLLGWAVREAATNVVRHSNARYCEIEVRRANGHATLEVRDDGAGPEPAGAGRGLTGLAERLAEAGGWLEAGRSAGGGWRLAATVPIGAP
jgi:two-component system sensor histidine kinase DesK